MLCEENIDNCDPDPCHHGQCQDGIDSYTCVCNPGYMGAICSDQIDECYSSPCLNEGRCIDLVNGYQCNCQPGTSGKPALFTSPLEVSPLLKIRSHKCLRPSWYMLRYLKKIVLFFWEAQPKPWPETSRREVALAREELRDGSFRKLLVLCVCCL